MVDIGTIIRSARPTASQQKAVVEEYIYIRKNRRVTIDYRANMPRIYGVNSTARATWVMRQGEMLMKAYDYAKQWLLSNGY